MFFNPECVMDVLKFTLNNKSDLSLKPSSSLKTTVLLSKILRGGLFSTFSRKSSCVTQNPGPAH